MTSKLKKYLASMKRVQAKAPEKLVLYTEDSGILICFSPSGDLVVQEYTMETPQDNEDSGGLSQLIGTATVPNEYMAEFFAWITDAMGD